MEDRRGDGHSRREFLTGVGSAGVALGTVTAWPGGEAGAVGPPVRGAQEAPGIQRFGRMFREPPFAEDSPQLQAALLEIAAPGGMLDAKDALERGPIDLIVDPALSENNPNNPTHTAGTTFMGQFMDHDMTFDPTSRLAIPAVPLATKNFRSPAFDLDLVYGLGPFASHSLYDSSDAIKFKIETGGLFEDLPRAMDNSAVIPDPRNDENLIIAGLHAAVLLFHNHLVDEIRATTALEPLDVFEEARRLTTWHYQWLILHEFLPQFIGQPMVDLIRQEGRRFFTPPVPIIPVEFQGAAFRFGHSMVRPSYRANLAGDNGQPFFGFILDAADTGHPDPPDLSGGTRAPRRFIGWQTFFDFGDGEVKPNKAIDTKLSTPLFQLPPATIVRFTATDIGPTSLPQRTLLRHITWALPSGQRLARKMGASILAPGDLADLSGFGLGLERSTPLFLYILREAELLEGGHRLGPVGGRIVGEVILGLLETDPTSFLAVDPGWQPTIPSGAGPGAFRMVDFLTFAGVDPASRGQ